MSVSIGVHPWLKKYSDGSQGAAGIGCAAGNDPAGLPKTVNSIMPSGVARGQLIIVSRTKRDLVGGISSKIVLRTMAFVLWSSTVAYVLPSLWEASYAHYRIGDYEKTLGNLITLQSPYFRDEYFPESYVLKSIVYYENCRYPEARQVLDQFSRTYEPVYDQLVKITASQRTPASYYELVRDAAGAPGGGPMRKIMRVAMSDQTVRKLSESIGDVEREMDTGIGDRRAEFRGSPLAKDLLDKLKASRATMMEEAGARTRAKLEYERDGLRQLLAQALRITIEVSRKEREALEV